MKKSKKILKESVLKEGKKEIKIIQRLELSSNLKGWVEEYEKVGERNMFFWKFMYRINQVVKPFDIPKKYENSNIEIKFLMVMFIILLDDLADRIQDKDLLDDVLKILLDQKYVKKLGKFNKKEREYLKFITKLWYYIKKIIKKYPQYQKFRDIFDYDVKQTINAMSYACLINRNPYLINKTEYWLYSPHTLQGMINCTLDLMCLSKFNIEELGRIREIFWRAQKMARVVNCLSTWKREINEGDLTSGILAYAINDNLLNIKDLRKNKRNIIDKINFSNFEGKLLKEWHQCYDEIRYISRKIKSINSIGFLSQLERLFSMYLITGKYYK